jgi:hypothetical protein
MGLGYRRWYKGLIEYTAQHGAAEMRAFRELANYVVYTEELGI